MPSDAPWPQQSPAPVSDESSNAVGNTRRTLAFQCQGTSNQRYSAPGHTLGWQKPSKLSWARLAGPFIIVTSTYSCGYVSPHLEFAIQTWSPWTDDDCECLEKVQRRAVDMISGFNRRLWGKTEDRPDVAEQTEDADMLMVLNPKWTGYHGVHHGPGWGKRRHHFWPTAADQ
jgi:hypothetical protein